MSTARPHSPATARRPRRVVRLAASAMLAALAVVLLPGTAWAVDGSIAHVERTDSGLQVSVDVPPEVEVDLDGVTATVDGVSYEASAARLADGDSLVQRTTVLAIDTSASMEGDRFEAAKSAATTFLDTVPDDVAVGIVSFDSDVEDLLEPTTDRDAARAVIDTLTLSRETLLYDGVLAALELAAAEEGQGSVLVLSDGADTSSTALPAVVDAVDASSVTVDVVALEQGGKALAKLERLAGANGRVISADSDDLAATFSAEAEVLARQVGVTVEAPIDAVQGQIDVAVTLPSDAGDVVATSSLLDIGGSAPVVEDEGLRVPAVAPPSTDDSPDWFIYAGVGVFAVGLVLAAVLLVPGKPAAMTAEERVTTYTSAMAGGQLPEQPKQHSEPALTQASDAVAGVLQRNKGLEDKIAAKLEAAGSELKPAEWLLVHAAAFVITALVGLLLGGGNIVVGLIFMAVGVVAPWIYLSLRASRRRKKFNAMLPETLQLMSGSLSAGLSLLQSVDTIVREGADPVQSAFRRVLIETRLGISLEDALDAVADRFDSKDFRWVVMAIRIQRQVGGNLAELLNTVAATMREREYIRRQVAALAAEGKLSAIVLGFLPPGFLLYLVVAQRDYVSILFTDPRGIAMLVGAAAWLAVGVFWMSKLAKVDV